MGDNIVVCVVFILKERAEKVQKEEAERYVSMYSSH